MRTVLCTVMSESLALTLTAIADIQQFFLVNCFFIVAPLYMNQTHLVLAWSDYRS